MTESCALNKPLGLRCEWVLFELIGALIQLNNKNLLSVSVLPEAHREETHVYLQSRFQILRKGECRNEEREPGGIVYCQEQGVEDVDMRSRVSVGNCFRSQILADKTSIPLVWINGFLHVLYPCLVDTALHDSVS